MNSSAVVLRPRTVLAATLIVGAAILSAIFLWSIGDVLISLFLGIVVAETIRPLVLRLERWHIPNAIAVALIYLVILLVLVGLGVLIIPPLVDQFGKLASRLPSYVSQIQEFVPRYYQVVEEMGLMEQLDSALSQGAAELARLLGSLSTLPFTVIGNLFSVFSVLVIPLFWFDAAHSFDKAILSKVGTKRQEQIRVLSSHMSQRVGGWLRGQLLLMSCVGLASLAGLLLLGVNFPLPLAIWAGLMEFIPYVGPWLGAVPAVIIAALASPWQALAVAVLYFAIQQLEAIFLVPKVMQQAVGLHPLVVILALLAGGASLGFAGVLVAIPLAGVLQVLTTDLVLPWLEQHGGDVEEPTSSTKSAEDSASREEPVVAIGSPPGRHT